jgi:hypothetical protein
MENFQLEHTFGQWMLFTVSSSVRLKTLLLHYGNKISSVLMVRAVHTTETHEYLHVLLQKIFHYDTGGIHELT